MGFNTFLTSLMSQIRSGASHQLRIWDCGLRIFSQTTARPEATPYQGLRGRLFLVGLGRPDPPYGCAAMSLDQARPEATRYRGWCERLFLVGPGRPRPALWLCCHVSRPGASGGHALPGFVQMSIFGRAGASHQLRIWDCGLRIFTQTTAPSGGHALPRFVRTSIFYSGFQI